MEESLEDVDGRQFLGRVRTALGDLPIGAASTASVWAVLDLLLQTPSSGAVPASLREYWETQQWLQQVHPELSSALAIERLASTQSSSVETFRISTVDGVYVLAVQTQDPQASRTAWANVQLPRLSATQAYRLEEVITGEIFPWDPPFHYLGTYLRGETDRFGSSNHEERWGIRPGDQRADFQLFHVVEAGELDTQTRWGDLIADPQLGAPAHAVVRQSGQQQHTLLRDAQLGLAADVITGPAVPGGQYLMVVFTNGNAGVGFRNAGPFSVQQVRSIVRGRGAQRGVEFQVCTPSSRMEFGPGDYLLDTVRHLREWNSWDAGRGRANVFREFAEAHRNLPRAIHVTLHREGIPLPELARRIFPRIICQTTVQDQRLYVFRPTLGGHFYAVEMTFPLSYQVAQTHDRFSVQAPVGESLCWRMAVTTDFPSLTLLTRDQLIGAEWLAHAQASPVLREEVEDLEFLACQEFFAAGCHRFLQFFGRDTLYWLHMFAPLLTPGAHETVLQTVLQRASTEGRLPSVEEMHDQTAFELMERFCWACRQPEATRIEEVLNASRAIQHFAQQEVPPTDLKCGVLDVDFMLLPAIADYLRRDDVPPQEKAAFLTREGRPGAGNLVLVLGNMDWIIEQAERYLGAAQGGRPWPSGLLGVEREGDCGNWRDVTYGLGYGLYPADVNAELLPAALRAAGEIRGLLSGLPNAPPWDLNRLAETHGLKHLAAWLETPEAAGSLVSAWQEASGRFYVELTTEEVRERVSRFLQHCAQARERTWLLSQPLGAGVELGDFLQAGGPVPAILRNNYRYFPVSLDRQGRPVPVVASDNVLALTNDQMPPERLIEVLTPLLLPYPVGLWTPVGFMVASPSLSNDERLWQELGTHSYGGAVIYGWQMGYFRHGLYRQLMRRDLASDPRLREVLYSAFEAAARASPVEEVGHELWTWDVGPEGFRCVAFGATPAHNDESNPVQLWSLSAADALSPCVRATAQQAGLRILSHEQVLDALAEARTRHSPSLAGLNGRQEPGSRG